jgi:hypothetical protein
MPVIFFQTLDGWLWPALAATIFFMALSSSFLALCNQWSRLDFLLPKK